MPQLNVTARSFRPSPSPRAILRSFSSRRFRALARGVGLEHTTTKPDVIGHFLLVHVGRPRSEVAVAVNLERILRLQPFLADATVRVVLDSVGGVRIEVETVDEIPTIFSMNWRPGALQFGNGNVRGQGLSAAVSVEQGYYYRTGAGA